MTYQTYTLTRVIDGDRSEFAQSFTTSDDDAVNCAHMLAAGFNTMSRNFLNGATLAVVYSDGRVQYDGKIETIERPKADEPWSFTKTFKFEPSTDPESMIRFTGEDGSTIFTGFSSVKIDEELSETLAKSAAEHIARSVLEDAYVELQAVKEVLSDAGVETIPAHHGVNDLRAVLRARDMQIDELVQERANRDAERVKYESDEYMPLRWESFAKIDDALRDNDVTNKRLDEGVRELGRRLEHEYLARTAMEEQYGQANEAARAELIRHVKGAYGKWSRVDPGRTRSDMKSHLRGMVEVLSKYLVAIGEADADERHAVALRVCEIPEGNYLYDDA